MNNFTVRVRGELTRATEGASGYDLYSQSRWLLFPGEQHLFECGVSLEMPPELEAQIRPRSSLSAQKIVAAFGTIDSDYRGELMVLLHNLSTVRYEVLPGQRIAQLVFARVEHPILDPVLVLADSKRGSGGFGSTGK